MKDIIMDSIIHVLDEAMERYEFNKNKVACSLIKRSKVILEKLTLNNVEIYGLNYEDFCEQFSEKRNIVFMSDEELKNFNRTEELLEKLHKIERIANEE